MLAAALVGFVLLIELLGSVTSSGPDSLVAPAPSDDPQLALPGVGGVFSYALTAAAIIVAVVGLMAFRNRLSAEGGDDTRRLMLIAVAVALVFVAAVTLLAFSDPLNPDAGLGEHLASRSLISPAGVVMLSIFFLSVAVVGVLRPPLLLVLLIIWALVGLATGIFDLPGLDIPLGPGSAEGLTEQERRGIDGRVFFVLMGFTLSLAVVLAMGRPSLILACFLVWIVIGFLFVQFGPEKLGGPLTEFDPFADHGEASIAITLAHGVFAAVLAFACICLVLVGIFNFLILQRRFKEGFLRSVCEVCSGVSGGRVSPARCVAVSPPATAATHRARSSSGAASHAPPGTPGAG